MSQNSPPQEQYQCKICLTDDPSMVLCHPCGCAGSMGAVHLECLSEWIQAKVASNSEWDRCEICHERYKIEFKPKPLFKRHHPHLKPAEAVIFIASLILAPIFLLMALCFFPLEIVLSCIYQKDWTIMVVCGIIQRVALDIIMLSIGIKFSKSLMQFWNKWKAQNMELVPKDEACIIHRGSMTQTV
ncbi:hypothetical protein BLNAU_18959 [Blattamonas nauphoetae]|uniref:RING-CH-type domain-containing protein n=1 Tax=Blattamonas nauphoetae TaxID=2049346 RepID=A0ABQ9X345_9EUKA|nr:hypothetical protein BLNAU_18959 [Blattamonas nauphoetae]